MESILVTPRDGEDIFYPDVQAASLRADKANPRTGSGKPKWLRYHDGEVWSRKINEKDRLVYRIYEDDKPVLILQVMGHNKD